MGGADLGSIPSPIPRRNEWYRNGHSRMTLGRIPEGHTVYLPGFLLSWTSEFLQSFKKSGMAVSLV